jgi:hypothetical protein
MPDFMLMVLEDEAAHAAQAPHEMAALIDGRARFVDGLRRAGALRDGERFRPSEEGLRLRRTGDRLETARGPFAEDGRALGACYWVDARDLDDAAQLASACPILATDEIDVRPLMKGHLDRDIAAKPGKIFGCAVLGNAATEAAWVQVMDRIDAETRDRFDAVSLLGGVRLQPPTSGRRIVARGERRAQLDGPFLECKEVIGGVFYVRMTSLDDVARWAGETRFLSHGALEIREVWRS